MTGVAPERPAYWESQRERGTILMMRLLRGIAMHFGRPVARLVLYPLSAYFLLTSATTRRVSRDYLARALGRPPGWRDVARHVFTFASTSLDRVFLLTESHEFKVQYHGADAVLQAMRRGGTLLFVAHFGSFEVIRVGAALKERLTLRIVVDGKVGRQFMTALAELNPEIAAGIIDSADRGLDHVLVVRDALAQGALVGMMVDRVREGERSVIVDFLGAQARFPTGPWLLAAALKVPVIAAFSVYHGRDEFEVSFVQIADRIDLPRSTRDAALQGYVQRYADELAQRARAAPYNWSNFFDFWAT
jgi:predicted LPLAT superfamily acyltransferase